MFNFYASRTLVYKLSKILGQYPLFEHRLNSHYHNSVINGAFDLRYNRAWLVHKGPATDGGTEVRWSFPATPQISTLLKQDQPARKEAIVRFYASSFSFASAVRHRTWLEYRDT